MKVRTRRLLTNGLMPVYAADFFLAFHYASIMYVNSSFLEKFFSRDAVSLIFIAGSIATIVFFLYVIHLEKKWGNRGFFFLFIALEIISVFAMVFSDNPWIVASGF